MCTAISYKTSDHYFGRNLDLERGYNEGVVITPRNYPFPFRFVEPLIKHYAMIGMATVVDGYPLYFEATNEYGLSMAGLNFPKNAVYYEYKEGIYNIAPFELIPYLLGLCSKISDVRELLRMINVVNCNFSEELPASPLHWMIADKETSIVLECTGEGMKIYDNPYGVLTNNPRFSYHLANINNYMSLHEGFAENKLTSRSELENYSLGLGAFGLPGDFSSASRFVRAVFVREKSVCDGSEWGSVTQFFHILQSVSMPKGCVMTKNCEYEYTRYSCCCNTEQQIYYYTTYDNPTIRQVKMHSADLLGNTLSIFEIE